jgi:hypothetical protein
MGLQQFGMAHGLGVHRIELDFAVLAGRAFSVHR